VTEADPPSTGRPTARAQLRVWLAIGSQSVGGGAATLLLMRRLLIRRERWLTESEFVQDWTLSRTSPGLTLIGLAALLGRRIDGRRGIALALGGLLVPSAAITIALAAGFVYIRDQPLVQAAIDGIAPATIGLTLAMMVVFVRSSIRPGRTGAVDLAVVTAAVVAGVAIQNGSIPIIVAGAALGWLLLGDPTPMSGPATPDAVERDRPDA
jgi:chromate transporter